MSFSEKTGSGAATGAAVGTVIPGVGNVIGGVIGGAIGAGLSIFGGTSRSEKRANRKAYWDFLQSQGVEWDNIKNWHSDDWAAGADLVKVYETAPNPAVATMYLNQVLNGGKITRGAARSISGNFPEWLTKYQNETQTISGGGGLLSAGISNPATAAAAVVVAILIIMGIK